jgi:hypothetical protein
MINRGPGFLEVILFWLLAHPFLPLFLQLARSTTHRKTEKERQVDAGRGVGEESYDRKKAWFSVKYSILSDPHPLSPLPQSAQSKFLSGRKIWNYPSVVYCILLYEIQTDGAGGLPEKHMNSVLIRQSCPPPTILSLHSEHEIH